MSGGSADYHGAVVVAVLAVWVVQVAKHQIVHMIAVRDGVVATACAVDMVVVVGAAGVVGCTGVGVGGVDREGMVVVVVAVDVMEMSVVEVVHMPVVLDAFVTATGAVDVPSVVVPAAVVPMVMVVPVRVVVIVAAAWPVYVSAHGDLPSAKGTFATGA